MIERGLLRVPQVVQNGARGGHRQRVAGQTAALQREQAEVIAQGGLAVVEAEGPVLHGGAKAGQAV